MNIKTTFSESEILILKSMIGKNFDKLKCDPFIYSPAVYGIVGLYINDESFKLTSQLEKVKRFFNNDYVSVFHIKRANESEITTFMDNGEFIEFPVSNMIVSIDVVIDHQSLEYDGKIESLDYLVGLVFHLKDKREISFEIKTWFSEMINIEKGYNLIEKFIGIDDFLEEWEGCDGYIARCHREIITLN